MRRHAIRIWLPDRPGGLGAVASRIGAVGGEIIGIEIIDRDGGQAIDDLFVELPPVVDSALLLREIGEVDGVHVESIRTIQTDVGDGRVQAFDAALALAAAPDLKALCSAVVVHADVDAGAEWVAVADLDAGSVLASHGEIPDDSWVVAFANGQKEAGWVADGDAVVAPPSHGFRTPDTIGIAFGPDNALAVVLSRPGRGFLRQERRTLAMLADLAGCHVPGLSG